jgi:hypothetical protein
MLIAELKVRLLSVIVGSVLSALGIIKNDVFLIIAAIVISPIGAILNDLAKDIMLRKVKKSAINLSLLVLIVLCAIVIGYAFGKMSDELSEDIIRQFTSTGYFFNAFIGFMLGMFTAYITYYNQIPDISIETQLVGIGVAITLLPPLVDMGLRFGQKTLSNKLILRDFKISIINAGSFLIGAMIINHSLDLL